jgi:hypothetical protein
VAIAERTDAPLIRADALLALAHVQSETGSPTSSERTARRALACYRAKGSIPGIEASRSLLASITAA